MSFDISKEEVAKLCNDYRAYQADLSGDGGALCEVDDACTSLLSLDSFQGAAAQSIKSYFEDTHAFLAMSIAELAKQLLTDYNVQFENRLDGATEGDGHYNARWPESDMISAATAVLQYKVSNLEEVKSGLNQAVNMLPAGCSFAMSQPTALADAIHYEFKKTSDIKNAVGEVDSAGAAAFKQSDGAFMELAASVGATIAGCSALAGRTSGQYKSGSFESIARSTGLYGALQKSRANQAENSEIVSASCERSIKTERASNEAAVKEALKQKKAAAWWGLAGTALIIAGGLVTIATAGAASPVLLMLTAVTATYGVGKATVDMGDRINQIGELYWGDPLADKTSRDYSGGDAVNKSGKFAKTVIDSADKVRSRDAEKINQGAGSLKRKVIKDVTNEMIDHVEDEVGMTDTAAGAWFDGAQEMTGELVDQALGGGFDGAGLLTAAGKATTTVSDYYLEEADQKLENLNERSQTLDRVEKSSGKEHIWGAERDSYNAAFANP